MSIRRRGVDKSCASTNTECCTTIRRGRASSAVWFGGISRKCCEVTRAQFRKIPVVYSSSKKKKRLSNMHRSAHLCKGNAGWINKKLNRSSRGWVRKGWKEVENGSKVTGKKGETLLRSLWALTLRTSTTKHTPKNKHISKTSVYKLSQAGCEGNPNLGCK